MCWNENISLNTFIFSFVTLLFVAYNNKYTKYKLTEFNNPFLYLLILSVISMQLVEYFLWKSIRLHDINLNHIWSMIGSLVLLSQPLAFSLLITNKQIQHWITNIYIIFLVIILLLKYPNQLTKFTTFVSNKNNNLTWDWNSKNPVEYIYYFVYWIVIFISTMYLPNYLIYIIFITLIGSILLYRKYPNEMQWGSKWCWSSNILSLYYIIQIMFVLPWKDMISTYCF